MELSSHDTSLSRVHLTNVRTAPGGCRPSDQANQLGLWVSL